MKKAERIDIGKQCVHKMIDENLSYRDLELIPFNGEIFSKDTLKKYIELYIEQESVENPDNPVIARFQNYKLRYIRDGLNKLTIDNIISLSPEEFKESIGKLSLEQIKRRLLVLSADETRASDVAPYITIINEYLDEVNRVRSEKRYGSDNETFDNKMNYIIDLYINSPVIELRHLRIEPNVMAKTSFLDQVKNIADETVHGGNRYSDQIKSKVSALLNEVKRREDEARDIIVLISGYILNGIPKGDKLESFDMFDYYSLTKYSVPDLAATALALSKRDTEPLEKSATVLATFRDRVYKSDYRTSKENIIKYQYTENGRVLFSDEIDSIISYLNARGIPLTQRTYQGAYHEYVNGRLQIKQI